MGHINEVSEVNEVNFEAVVFDCDGLLLDTERSWQKGERELFARHAIPYTDEARMSLLGAGEKTVGGILARLFGLPGEEHELTSELLEISRVFVLAEAAPMPGARELVASLEGEVPLGVASNSPSDLVREVLAQTGLFSSFDIVLGGDDIDEPKPAPDLYALACTKLGVKPERAVAFEDSPTGAAAAKSAGMFVVGVPAEPEVTVGADLIVGSLEDPEVKELLFG